MCVYVCFFITLLIYGSKHAILDISVRIYKEKKKKKKK